MANKERNKRSARQARQRERAAQEQAQVSAASSSAKPAKAPAPVVKAKPAKQGLLGRIGTYFGAVRSEMRRVVWPSRKELTNYSVAVAIMLVVFGVLVWAVDTGFVALLVAFTGLRG